MEIKMALVKDIFNNVKTIKDIADATANLDLKSAIVDLKEQILELREENLQMRENLSVRDSYNMQFEHNMYYNLLQSGKKEGPYCSGCWDTKKQAVRMHCRGDGYCCCPNCKREVFLESYSPFIGCSL